MIQMKMKTGLSGPMVALAPGDVHHCEDHLEAARLDRAGFAGPADDEAAEALKKAHVDLAAKEKAGAKKA